jgi:hypothetical protein
VLLVPKTIGSLPIATNANELAQDEALAFAQAINPLSVKDEFLSNIPE